MTSKPDFKVMVLLLVFMQLTRDQFAIAKFLFALCEIFSQVKGGHGPSGPMVNTLVATRQ